MIQRLPRVGDHLCGAELLRRAWEGDAEGVVAGGLYKRAVRALGRPSVVLGAGGRRYWFVRVESDLTEKQRTILDWICRFEAEHGWMPTLRQIGTEFGITSTNGVNDHLKALVRKGYIRRDAATARGMVILRDANGHAAEDWMSRALTAEAQVIALKAQLRALRGQEAA